jgi:hypothetical protein
MGLKAGFPIGQFIMRHVSLNVDPRSFGGV